MVVIADTSPLNYLILAGHPEVLPHLFGDVLIPPAVLNELTRQGAPTVVREFINQRPSWLRVAAPLPALPACAPGEALDDGEREAIALADSMGPGVLLLIDDDKGRQAAERRRIPVLGTLGVLDLAASKGLIELRTVLDRLLGTNFHVSRKLVDRLLSRDAERRKTIR